MARPKDPYAVTLSAEHRAQLEQRLVDEIRLAKQARTAVIQEKGLLDFYWSLYEQQSQKGISRDTHRYGGADLTSPIGTENVDALSSRMVKTIFTEPLWIVEGIGDSGSRAPLVEEFLQWRQESMRLQATMRRAIPAALVETGAVVEVCEDAEPIIRTEVYKAQPLVNPDGTIELDHETGQPLPQLDPMTGDPVEAMDPEFSVEVKQTWTDYRRRGAFPRLRRMKDFLFLPSHAEDAREVWGHAVRYYLPMDEIGRKVGAGEFDKATLEKLAGGTHQREIRTEHERVGVTVEVRHGEEKVEKELWRVQFWMDLGEGVKCYLAVVSEIDACLLSLRCDWLTQWRTVYLNPYPCSYSVYGYSLIGTKLLTTIEEHTAWRNMNADRATLKANAPLKRLSGALWDPNIQPFGADQVIDVASMDEVQVFEFEDVSVQSMNKEAACVADAQRIVGMNDIAVGQVSAKARTLGENEMATRESFTRTDDPIGNIQEAMEELGSLIHAIEVKTLEEIGADGLSAPTSIAESAQYRTGDTSFSGTFQADMVKGEFRFKPRGSVESADPVRRLQMWVQGWDLLAKLAAVNPHVGMRLQSPQMAQAMLQGFVTEMKPRDKEPFLAPVAPPGMPGDPMADPMAAGGMAPEFGGGAVVDQLLASLPPGGVQ